MDEYARMRENVLRSYNKLLKQKKMQPVDAAMAVLVRAMEKMEAQHLRDTQQLRDKLHRLEVAMPAKSPPEDFADDRLTM